MGIDPSGRGKDDTAVVVVAHMNGFLYLLHAEGLKGGYDTGTLIRIAEIAKRYQVNKIFVESNFGDGMYSTLLNPVLRGIYPCMLEEVRATTFKEGRIIDTLEPLFNQHRLIVSIDVVRQDILRAKGEEQGSLAYSLFYQMTHITRDRGSLSHDDLVDCLAMVVAQWMNILIQDPEEALNRYKQRELERVMTEMVRRHTPRPSSSGFASKHHGVFRR